LVGPQLLYLVVRGVYTAGFATSTPGYCPLDQVEGAEYHSGWAQAVAANDPLVQLHGDGVLELLFTGAHPAVSWMPFLLAGMALGRLDLASVGVRVRLAVLGPALAVLGYGGSWLAFQIFPGVAAAAGGPNAWWLGAANLGAASQLVAAPHSQTRCRSSVPPELRSPRSWPRSPLPIGSVGYAGWPHP